MSREDNQSYAYGNVEIVELGIDHNGHEQWYMSTDEGWVEVGDEDGTITLSKEHCKVGTRIELEHPIAKLY